jgi:hypothetical protein
MHRTVREPRVNDPPVFFAWEDRLLVDSRPARGTDKRTLVNAFMASHISEDTDKAGAPPLSVPPV